MVDNSEASPDRNPVPERRRVLVIDDESSVRFITRKSLESGGIDVTEAENGQDALSILESERFDIIVCDLMMPVLDGRGFVSQFREKHRDVFTPILLVTAVTDISTKVSLLELGGDDYLLKPYHHRELLARVKVLIRLRDMTEALRAESVALRASNDEIIKLQEELLQKERTSALLTVTRSALHIIRQPLSAALLLSSFLVDKVKSGEAIDNEKIEKVREYLFEIERAVDSIGLLDMEQTEDYVGAHSIYKIKERGEI